MDERSMTEEAAVLEVAAAVEVDAIHRRIIGNRVGSITSMMGAV